MLKFLDGFPCTQYAQTHKKSYDTLLGVRGELNAQVKLQFFGDINPFKDSSAGVQFFTLNSIPATHQVVSILGFVSAVDNEDDPEYVCS